MKKITRKIEEAFSDIALAEAGELKTAHGRMKSRKRTGSKNPSLTRRSQLLHR